jgi:hypothetical protein
MSPSSRYVLRYLPTYQNCPAKIDELQPTDFIVCEAPKVVEISNVLMFSTANIIGDIYCRLMASALMVYCKDSANTNLYHRHIYITTLTTYILLGI